MDGIYLTHHLTYSPYPYTWLLGWLLGGRWKKIQSGKKFMIFVFNSALRSENNRIIGRGVYVCVCDLLESKQMNERVRLLYITR